MKDAEKQRHLERAEFLIAQQNFGAAVVAGAVAMFVAAMAYGITVAVWPFSYGFAAAGVGIVVGLATGFLGRGISAKFGMLAAGYTVLGCVVGNLFAKAMDLAIQKSVSPLEVLRGQSLSTLADWSVSGLSPIDLVFWCVAVAGAVFFATRSLSRQDRLALGLYESRGRS